MLRIITLLRRSVGLCVLAAGLVLIGCSDQATLTGADQLDGPDMALESAKGKDVATAEADAELQKALASLRQEMTRYKRVQNALDDGYGVGPGAISPYVPQMGFHYLNLGLLDGQANVNEPEALVYQSYDPNKKTRRLGAVEYIIPGSFVNTQSDLPSLFPGQTSDDWHFEEEIGAWTLHAWIFLDNPEGVFHGENPRVRR